jgi:hypothetical protein
VQEVGRPLVAAGGLVVPAELVVGAAEAVVRGGLTEPVTGLLEQRERRTTVGHGLLLVTELPA